MSINHVTILAPERNMRTVPMSRSVSLQQHHVEAVIKDVAHSVARYGIKILILVNGHDANYASMKYATRELADELDIPVIYQFYPNLNKLVEELCDSLPGTAWCMHVSLKLHSCLL